MCLSIFQNAIKRDGGDEMRVEVDEARRDAAVDSDVLYCRVSL